MKKRFFAGLLACLMVVGLLPLSMLLKPVSAKADITTGKREFSSEKLSIEKDESKKNEEIDLQNGFSIYRGSGSKTESNKTIKFKGENAEGYVATVKYATGGKADIKPLEKKISAAIKFEASKGSKVKVWWQTGKSADTARTLDLYDSDGNKKYTKEAGTKDPVCTDDIVINEDGIHYIGGAKENIYIYRIVIETGYTVTVVDSVADETKETAILEGDTFDIVSADKKNFLYWVNSYGRIVSRDAEYSFPVYYSDTYTAVYKSAETTYNFMTDYDQVYKTYTASDLAIPTSPVKYGYEFDYWKIGETKVSTVQEIKDAGTGTDVEIKPVYKEVTENVSITINGITKEYKKNKEVTADATGLENFMYWYVSGDDGGESKILSYSSLYSFFADDKITSISAKCGTDTVKKSGIITHITNDVNGNNKTFVFEFTVPDDYKIEFAGIVASSTYADPNLTNYEYIRGRGSNAKTVRYSWTKTDAADKTWYVRPVLKYSDSEGNVTTVIADDVQSL